MVNKSAARGTGPGYGLSQVLLLVVALTTACSVSDTRQGPFVAAQRISKGQVDDPRITEASGLAASRKNPGVLWTHNDSGHDNRVYAIDTDGRLLRSYAVPGCPRGDWEDIALGPGPLPGVDYLYVGDIGDNRGRRPERTVCRVPEPSVTVVRPTPGDAAIGDASLMRFRYADGPRDAEALMVDPRDGAIYIVSKREAAVGVYRAQWPDGGDVSVVLTRVAELPLSYAVAGDISGDGRHLLVKTYTGVFLWSREPDQDWAQVFGAEPVRLAFVPEIGGESIAWAKDGSGFYTLAERLLDIPSTLWFYGLDKTRTLRDAATESDDR